MISKHAQDLVNASQRGEDISDRPGVDAWMVDDTPIQPSDHPDGPVIIGKSVRLTFETVEQINTLAKVQNSDFSKLTRRWILEGLARESGGAVADLAAEAERIAAGAAHLAQTLRQQAA